RSTMCDERLINGGFFYGNVQWRLSQVWCLRDLEYVLRGLEKKKIRFSAGGRKPLSCSEGKPNYLYRVSSFILTFVKCSFMYFLVASMSLAQKASYIFKCS